MLRSVLVIALTALIVSACCSSREVMHEVRGRMAEMRDSARVEQVMVAVHDTIRETTTITVRENEAGDTLRMSRVTERDRVSERAHVKNLEVDVRVVRDTVYLERRDSSSVKNAKLSNPMSRASPFERSLKWIFGIVVALIGLGIVFKIKT